MDKSYYYAVFLRPLGALHLHGSGLRAAMSRGPGAIPSEEPLLPRLETILGSIVSGLYMRIGGGPQSCDIAYRMGWASVVLEPIREHLFGLSSPGVIRIYGPFLVAKPYSGKNIVYVNVSSGLLQVGSEKDEGIDDWVSAAYFIWNAARKASPRRSMEELDKAKQRLDELVRKKLLIESGYLITRRIGIALNPSSKTARHGLLYSTTDIDYLAVLSGINPARLREVEIVIVAKVEGNHIYGIDEFTVPRLGPRGPSSRAYVKWLGVSNQASKDANHKKHSEDHTGENRVNPMEVSLALTNTPKRLVDAVAPDWVIHPSPPGPPLEQHTRSYATALCGLPLKDPPEPSLWPGTVIKHSGQSAKGESIKQIYTLKDGEVQLVYAPRLDELKNIVSLLID